MEVRYQRELNENYLVLEDTCPGDEYAVRMLAENEIPGFLKMKRKQMDRTWSFYYEISGRQSVQRILERRPVSSEELRRLFCGIDAALQTLEKYLLLPDGVRLEPEFIYVKPDFSDPLLCYYPADMESFFNGARRLTQYFLNKIDHADAESVEIVYEMFRISGEDDFGFRDLMQVFHKEEEEAEAEIYLKGDTVSIRQEEHGVQLSQKKENGEDRQSEWNRQKDRWNRAEKREEELEPWSISKEREDADKSLRTEYLTEKTARPFCAIFLPAGGFLVLGALYFTGCLNRFSMGIQLLILVGGTAALIAVGVLLYWQKKKPDPVWESIREEAFSSGGPETELLCGKRPEASMRAILISQNLLHHENLEIDSFPWILGKVPGECTCLLDSQVISRLHARIEAGDGTLTLYDLGSTNGTFVNRKRLKEGEACILRNGDQVAFADFAYLLQI